MPFNTLVTLTFTLLLAVLLGSVFVVAKDTIVPIFFAAVVAYVITHLVAWVAEIGEEARPDMLKVAANATQVQL